MKRILMFAMFMSAIPVMAQTNVLSGYCNLGASQALTSGLPSTNYLQEVVPSCTVTVYLTGTQNLATIYSNPGNGPLTNPFLANLAGQWTFYSSNSQAYDVVLSGGVGSNVYPVPVVITGLFPPSSGGCGSNNLISLGCTGATTAAGALANLQGVSLVSTSPQAIASSFYTPAFNTQELFGETIVVQTGQTIPQAVALLPSSGGVVLVPIGSFTGGVLTKSNVTIMGSGIPLANTSSTPSFVTGSGSIILGGIQFLGASNISVFNLGADVGDTFNSGACTAQGVQVDGANQSITDPMIFDVDIENVSVIACDYTFAPTAAQHSTLLEHITHLKEYNIKTIGGIYGNVIKAIDADLTMIDSSGSNSYCFIIKSDDTNGISKNVKARGITCRNGGGLAIDTYGGTVNDVSMDGVYISNTIGTLLAPIALEGHIASDPSTGASGFINGVKISQLVIDTAQTDSVVFQNGSTNISIVDATIRNITGNGIDFQTTGASENSVDNLRLNNLSGYGFYVFGATDYAKNVSCVSVITSCLVSSGVGSTLTAENINAGGGTLFTSLAGGALAEDVIPGGISTPIWTAPTGVTPTITPGAGSNFIFNVTNANQTVNAFLIDNSYNWVNASGNIVFPGTAGGYVGASNGGVLLVTSGPVGTGGPVLQNSPPFQGTPTAPTPATTDSSNTLATTAFVKNAITAISAGVTSINGVGGIFTFNGNVSCVSTTCTFTSSGVSDVNLTVGAMTLNSGTCSPAYPATANQIGVSGLTTAMGIIPTWQADSRNTNGWNPASGTLTIKAWPDAAGGLLDWAVCNYTANTVGPTSSVGIRFVIQ